MGLLLIFLLHSLIIKHPPVTADIQIMMISCFCHCVIVHFQLGEELKHSMEKQVNNMTQNNKDPTGILWNTIQFNVNKLFLASLKGYKPSRMLYNQAECYCYNIHK